METDVRAKGSYGKDPLKGSWKSPTPLVVSLIVGVRDSSDDNATDGPAHLQSCCASTPETERNDLTSIGWGVGDEETPRDTFECLSDDEDFEGVGLAKQISDVLIGQERMIYKESDEYGCIHHE